MITFVGRLRSFRKGLTTLLESIRILNTLWNIPTLKLWFVGGDKEDTTQLKHLIESISHLDEMHAKGLVEIWGHLSPEGLSEIYSRSFLTIVPSYFEQFGMVAPEAMACGCPVIAAETGGLKDSIIPCVTGKFFAPEDSLQLAAIIVGYLRNPHIAYFEGGHAAFWAKTKFSLPKIYDPLHKAICGQFKPYQNTSPQHEYQGLFIEYLKPLIENELGIKLKLALNVSGNSHFSYKIEINNNYYHLKFFNDRPSFNSSFLTIPEEFICSSRKTSNINKCVKLSESKLSPNIMHVLNELGVIISEWHTPPNSTEPIHFSGILLFIEKLQRFGDYLLSDEDINQHNVKLAQLIHHPSEENIGDYYRAALKINSILEGNHPTYIEAHPQVCLLNLRNSLKKRLFPLPTKIEEQMTMSIELILNSFTIIPAVPKLSHGDIKEEHFITSGEELLVCDWETAGYRCGPYDIAIWLFKNKMGSTYGSVMEAIEHIEDRVNDQEDKILLVCWLYALACTEYLTRYLRGQTYDWTSIRTIFISIHEAVMVLNSKSVIR